MKPWMWTVMGAALATVAGLAVAADKKVEAKDSRFMEWSGILLLAHTNALGTVTNLTIKTPWGHVSLVTNGVSSATVREWAKFHDRAVAVKGNLVTIDRKMTFTTTAPIKDVTPSLKGGVLQVSLTEDDKVSFIMYRAPDGKTSYTVETNGMSEATLKGYYRMSEKPVEIDGKISQADMTIYGVRAIRAARPPAKKKGK
mgnify:FL=1